VGRSLNKFNIQRIQIIIILILILFPISTVIYLNSIPHKIKIGILLTTKDLEHDVEVVATGLNQFEGIFYAKVLNILYNESHVRVKYEKYLTDDYLDTDYSIDIRERFDVDIILIITANKINNWLGNRAAHWGIADTKRAMALMTAAQYTYNQTDHEIYLIETSIHEVLHLLGYQHPRDSRECIMHYSSLDSELNFEYKLELPFRVAFWKLGTGFEPGQTAFIINFLMNLIISFLFIAVILIIQMQYKKYFYKETRTSQTTLIFGLGIYMVGLLFISAFVYFFYIKIAIFISFVFLYVIIETLEYQKFVRKNKQK
jgi:predicted Zn-dependent protease